MYIKLASFSQYYDRLFCTITISYICISLRPVTWFSVETALFLATSVHPNQTKQCSLGALLGAETSSSWKIEFLSGFSKALGEMFFSEINLHHIQVDSCFSMSYFCSQNACVKWIFTVHGSLNKKSKKQIHLCFHSFGLLLGPEAPSLKMLVFFCFVFRHVELMIGSWRVRIFLFIFKFFSPTV